MSTMSSRPPARSARRASASTRAGSATYGSTSDITATSTLLPDYVIRGNVNNINHTNGSDGYADCPIYDRAKLDAGNRIKGPAIVEQATTTIVVTPGATLECDPWSNFLVRLPPASGAASAERRP